jgi:hypothetical protein
MTIIDVFEQARNSESSSNLSDSYHECYIDNGIKICKKRTSDEVVLYNTMVGGDYYQEISGEHLNNFLELGWEMASVILELKDATAKLRHIKEMIDKDSRKKPEYTKILNGKLNQIQEKWNRINTKLSLISA